MSDGLSHWLDAQYGAMPTRGEVLHAYQVFFQMHPIVARDLMRFTNYLGPSMDPSSERMTCFNEGKRSVFGHVMEQANLSRDQVRALLQVELPEEG